MSDDDAKLDSSLPNYCEQGGPLNHHVQDVVINEGGPENIMELDDSPERQAGRNVVEKETIPDKSRKSKGGQADLFCTSPGCTTKRAFRRRYELKRHMLKHTPNVSYGCPIVACNRRGPRAFYREDKLKAHLRSVHEYFDWSLCPVSGCGQGPLQYDLLRVHMSAHKQSDASEVLILSASSYEDRRCPVEKCRVGRSRWMPSDKIPGPRRHLMLRDEGERLEQRASITPKGYDTASGGLICPICQHICPEKRDFCQHLGDVHMTVTEHARLYVDAIRCQLAKAGATDQWCIWDRQRISTVRIIDFQFPGCSFQIFNLRDWVDPLEHPGFITSTEELYTHRREILRIPPDFHRHPVFDDVQRTR